MTESPPDHDDLAGPVGPVLARLRHERNLTGQQLGRLVKMSQTKISRIETGQITAAPADVGRLARALGATREVVDRLTTQAENAQNRMTDWRAAGGAVGGIQFDVSKIEAKTREFRVFQPNAVVGLAQTSEYARAVFASIDAFYGTPNGDDRVPASVAVAAAVSLRVRRQEYLTEPGRRFHFVMGESALSSRVAEPIHMLGQIERLRELAGQPNILLKLVPADAVLPFPLIHGFELLDDYCVAVDVFNTSMLSRGREDVQAYRRVFDRVEESATDDVEPLLDKYRRRYRDLTA